MSRRGMGLRENGQRCGNFAARGPTYFMPCTMLIRRMLSRLRRQCEAAIPSRDQATLRPGIAFKLILIVAHSRHPHALQLARKARTLGVPGRLAQGPECATGDQLTEVEILGAGQGLHWEALDADLPVPGLLAGLFGTKVFMARHAGQATLPANDAAARTNGAKGGRPRKSAQA